MKTIGAISILVLAALASSQAAGQAAKVRSAASPAATQKTFDTPEEAAQALATAAASDDTAALAALFGNSPQARKLIGSGDPARVKAERSAYAAEAQKATFVEKDPSDPNRAVIFVGESGGYPFSVPLVKSEGKWRFDTEGGFNEVRARAVGSNEYDAIAVCQGYVEAQFERAATHMGGKPLMIYSKSAISTPGKEDGLYWSGGSEPSPFSASVAKAFVGGPEKAVPFHGYYFKILTAQGANAPGGAKDYLHNGQLLLGFALVAWPAEYGESGIKTFMTSQEGLVYEKDLGPKTATIAGAMTSFNTDDSWRVLR